MSMPIVGQNAGSKYIFTFLISDFCKKVLANTVEMYLDTVCRPTLNKTNNVAGHMSLLAGFVNSE